MKRDDVVHGMVILEWNSKKFPKGPTPIKKFKAKIIVRENHSTSIRVGYQASMTIGALRTTVKLTKIHAVNDISLKYSKEQILTNSSNSSSNIDGVDDKGSRVLKQGQKADVELELMHRTSYFKVNDRIVLSEGNVKIVGIVTEI
jgi:GTPase